MGPRSKRWRQKLGAALTGDTLRRDLFAFNVSDQT
jgi:hypothetical protein